MDPSLFEMTFPLTDQDGRERHLSEFAGEPFVASMIYTNCKSVCPRIAADLKALDAALPAADRERVRFVLFSLDPERDTPEALRGFAAAQGLDTKRWTLLASSPDDMRTLAAVLDVRFRPDGASEIAHTAMIAVCDSKGVVRHRQAGVQADPSGLVAAVHDVR
ncbi:MAG: SCO family protein [Candidatus Eisenbacteria bacterium]